MKAPRSQHGRWTPERDDLIIRDYPANVPMGAILAAVNQMPGAPVTAHQLQRRATKVLKVFRDGVVGRAQPRQATPNWAAQPPPPPPLAARTHDGLPSLAWLATRDDDDSVPVSAEDVDLWLRQHAPGAAREGDPVQVANRARREFGLPPFRISTSVHGQLPPSWVGASD